MSSRFLKACLAAAALAAATSLPARARELRICADVGGDDCGDLVLETGTVAI